MNVSTVNNKNIRITVYFELILLYFSDLQTFLLSTVHREIRRYYNINLYIFGAFTLV